MSLLSRWALFLFGLTYVILMITVPIVVLRVDILAGMVIAVLFWTIALAVLVSLAIDVKNGLLKSRGSHEED